MQVAAVAARERERERGEREREILALSLSLSPLHQKPTAAAEVESPPRKERKKERKGEGGMMDLKVTGIIIKAHTRMHIDQK